LRQLNPLHRLACGYNFAHRIGVRGMHIVFISHASEDKAVADQVCAALENAGVRCWIAPRDINAGANWAKSILDAILTTKLMVLIYSKHTAKSPHVRREIERAVHRDIPIAPLRVENVMPEGDMEYFLSSSHWSDLFPGPIEQQIEKVPAKVCALLGIEPKAARRSKERPAEKVETVPETPLPRKNRTVAFAIAGAVLVIALCTGAFYHLKHAAPQSVIKPVPPQPERKNLFGSLGIEWVEIIPQTFQMGSPPTERDREPIETRHSVTLTKTFFIAKHEITQGQWQKVMDESFTDHCARVGMADVAGEGDNYPMYFISWTEASDFCHKLSQLSGQHVRLPTEAEWEFAARARSTSTYCFGDDSAQLKEYAWFADNSGKSPIDSRNLITTKGQRGLNEALRTADGATHQVGTLKANAYGLNDMNGNVWEWCEDMFAPYTAEAMTNPMVTSSPGTPMHIARGGSWAAGAGLCRSATRYAFRPDFRGNTVGFRIVADAP
jgi:formylglycine-generating enzyme required for sulfatase activity